jgi:predicted amidohydrolase
MMDLLTAAVVQAGTPLFDMQHTLAKVRKYCREAAQLGAALVVFPEAFLGGYPKGLSFGAHVGSRTEEGREEFRRYYDAAVEECSEEVGLLGKIAEECQIELIMGLVEREAGTLYCSVFFFSPDGRLQGKHRKLMPTGLERLIWGQGDGSTMTTVAMPAVQTDCGVIGAAICWENYMPLFRTAMYAKGVNLWCAPTVDDRESWQATMQHIAIEGRCFVLSACQYLLRSDCPPDYQPVQGNDAGTVLIKGGSVIVSPMGKTVAGPLRDGEGILIAALDLREVTRGKFDLDTVGHYARPDVFSLSVNERANHPVRFDSD